MATTRITQASKPGKLYDGSKVFWDGTQLVIDASDGTDLARTTMSDVERKALADQLNVTDPPPPPTLSKPTIPTGFTATAGDSKASLKWNPNPSGESVDFYQVYKNDLPLSPPITVTGTSYELTGLTNGQSVSLRISAHNSTGYGDWTNAITVVPQGSTPPPPSTGAIAKFHRPAFGTNATPAYTVSASRDQIIFLQGYWRTADLSAIKSANPNCKVLCYVNYTRVYTGSGALPYGNAIWSASQRPQYNSGIVDTDAGGNIAKIDVAGYGQDVVDTLTARFANTAWDGVMLDDMNHTGDGYLTATTWRTAMENVNKVVGPGLKAKMPNKIFIPNMTGDAGQHEYETGGWVGRQWDYFDGGLDEFSFTWPGGADRSQQFMDTTFTLMETIAAKGKYYCATSDSPDVNKVRFGMACVMLQTKGNTLFGAVPENSYQVESWYTDVHDRAKQLGAATGDKFSTGTKQWRRNFEHGYVTADLTTRVGAITLV